MIKDQSQGKKSDGGRSVSSLPSSSRRISARVWGFLNFGFASIAIAAILILLVPGYAQAEETGKPSFKERAGGWWNKLRGDPQQLPNRLMIRGGGASIFGANTNITKNIISGVGGTINYPETLGGDTEDSAIRVDALFRFNSRHSIGVSWYQINLPGQRVISESIEVDDRVISAGATTNSFLDMDLYRFIYNWSFYHTDKIEVAVSPGFYIADLGFGLSASGTITPPGGPGNVYSSGETLTLPLPSVGMLVDYNITPRWNIMARTDFFYLTVGEFEGSMFEFYAGTEYRLFKYLGFGIAYDRMSVDVTADRSDGFRVDTAFNLAYLYGTLYFFDTPL